jgi:hypothetical protein
MTMPVPGTAVETLRVAYAEVCNSYHAIDDFRSKLLALLPLASGTGIFLLLDGGGAAATGALSPYLSATGAFGLAASLGLYAYELRGIQRCISLIKIGADLEDAMNVAGQFTLRPGPVNGIIGTRTASFFVYAAVIAAWTFIATAGPLGPNVSYAIAAAVFVAPLFASRLLHLDPTLDDLGPRPVRG